MADDPYVVLGIDRGASEAEVKKAHRRLAKELHPDLRPDDHAAMERFKRVNAAYELLSDGERRRRFDRGEIDASGEARRPQYRRQPAGAGAGPGAQRTPDDDFGFGDIFSSVFGDQKPRPGRGPVPPPGGYGVRGADVRYTLEVDFLEAVLGAKKRVAMPEGGQLDLAVPEGVENGQLLRLRGKGSQGVRGGEAGDAIVEIKVRLHPELKRVGDDVHSELRLSLPEAILGTKVEVATTTTIVQLTIPKGTSSGKIFRLKGRGAKNTTTGHIGDHLVTVMIMLPDAIDEQLTYFMAEWRRNHPYDPRG